MSHAPRLTRAQVIEIRRRVADGETQSAVARSMDIGRDTVSKWIGHDRMPVLGAPTKADMAQRRAEAEALIRRQPRLSVAEVGRRVGVNETTVARWLARGEVERPEPDDDPLAGIEYRDVDVSDEWRRVGLTRWAYVPPRAETVAPRISEWVL